MNNEPRILDVDDPTVHLMGPDGFEDGPGIKTVDYFYRRIGDSFIRRGSRLTFSSFVEEVIEGHSARLWALRIEDGEGFLSSAEVIKERQ